MYTLINGQDISFDTHQAGDGQEINYKSLHMDKKQHGRGGVRVKFAFFASEKELSIENLCKKAKSQDQCKKVVNEIKKVLKKNPDKKIELAKIIVTQLIKFSNKEASLEEATTVAKNIASIFNLSTDFTDKVIAIYDNNLNLEKATTYHTDRDKIEFQIVQSSVSIKVGRKKKRYVEVLNQKTNNN